MDFSALLLNRKARAALGPIGLSGRLSLVLVHNIKPVLGLQEKKGTVLPGKVIEEEENIYNVFNLRGFELHLGGRQKSRQIAESLRGKEKTAPALAFPFSKPHCTFSYLSLQHRLSTLIRLLASFHI